MSDFFAPAGVTAVLKWTLMSALPGSGLDAVLGTQANISALPPDRLKTGADETPQLNLFMYHVGTNPAWRNLDLPGRDASGQPISNPPLPLTLHYLLSAYGKSEFDAEILLGWAMQILNDTPVLSRSFVRNALVQMAAQPGASSEVQAIATTTFPDQVESARLTPEDLPIEDMYRLWTAFQASYRSSAAYQVSVVLLQRTTPVRASLPVLVRNIQALPAEPPVIETLSPAMLATGEVLTLIGRNFVGDTPGDTRLLFDGTIELTPDLAQGNLIRFTLPPELPAGTRAVQVVRRVRFGSAGDPHAGPRSDPAPFMLLPRIVAPPASAATGALLTLTITPPVLREQAAALLLGNTAIDIPKRPLSDPASSSTLAFPIPAGFPHPPPPAGLPLRVRIDGAESALKVDTAPGPTQGQLVPQIRLTP
jgi:hypothetical protein